MAQLWKNNAASTLASPLSVGATTINLATGQGARFPTISGGGDYFLVTLYEKDNSGAEITYEVVKVTGRTGDALTVVRDFEGIVVANGGTSGGWAYPSAVGVNPSQVTYVELRYTAYGAGNNLTKDDNLASVGSAATARTNLGAEASVNKDASGGYAGLTLFKLNMRNVANTFTSWFTNTNTASRTYTLPDKNGTVAMTSDITGTNSGTNTGDETASTLGTKIAGATGKTTPADEDSLGLSDSAASSVLKSLTWANLKAAMLSYIVATVNTWTKAQIGSPVALSVSSNAVAVDLSLGNNFTLTLQATTGQTLSNPTNVTAGQSGNIVITQNATPSTLAFGGYWKSVDGTTPTVSTTANAVNVLSYYVVSSTYVMFQLNKNGVA